jgi:X-Pro dipeptidyl-peptidase
LETRRAALAAFSATVLAGLAALPAPAAGSTRTHSTHVSGAAALPALRVQVAGRARNPLYRGATTRSADQPPAGTVTINYDVATPEADLFMQVVHPTDANGNIIPAPVILSYTPYSFGADYNGDASHWVNELGYTRATADVIGTGNSGGCFDYGGNGEINTVHALINWIAAQKWSSGKIGMNGGSYVGTTQWAAAVSTAQSPAPKGLVTIVPEAAIDRWYDYAYAGGIRYTDTNEDLGNEGPGAASDEGVDTPFAFDYGIAMPPPTDVSDRGWAERTASKMTVCHQLDHTGEAYSDTPDYGGFWEERDYLRRLGSVKIPALVAQNWGDWNVKQVDGWQAFHALTRSRDSRAIFGGRWHGHGVPQDVPGSLSYSETVDKWYDHWLRGVPNGIPGSLAKITTRSADDKTEFNYTPAPDTQPLQLTLSHDANGFTLNPASGAAPTGSPAASYLWTGLNTESDAGMQPFAAGPGYIGFASPLLTHDLRIFGEPVLHVWSTTQRQWVTTAVSLMDFNPANYTGSGAQTMATSPNAVVALTRGWLDSRYRNGLDHQALVTPGQSFNEDLTLWPTDYTVRAGHRLVLLMSTETLEWAKSKVYGLASDSPIVQIDYSAGQSYLTLPAATASQAAFAQ